MGMTSTETSKIDTSVRPGDTIRIRTTNGGDITGVLAANSGWGLEGMGWAVEPWRVASVERIAR